MSMPYQRVSNRALNASPSNPIGHRSFGTADREIPTNRRSAEHIAWGIGSPRGHNLLNQLDRLCLPGPC